ncbi:MAG TPA: M14 family zinc carboxypeptidase [Candidatus Saccharimonadales bacterium]
MWSKNQLRADKTIDNQATNDADGRSADINYGDLESKYRNAVSSQQKLLDVIGLEKYRLDIARNSLKLNIYKRAHAKLKFSNFLNDHKKWTSKNRKAIYLYGGSSIALLVVLFNLYNFWPQTVSFNFANQKHCSTNLAVLPGSNSPDTDKTFNVSRNAIVSVAHIPILTDQLCLTANKTPLPQTSYKEKELTSIVGQFGVSKPIKIITMAYPSVSKINFSVKAEPVDKSLAFKLSAPDEIFSYEVIANVEKSPCTKHSSTLDCSPAPLNLSYSAEYNVTLERLFNSQSAGVVANVKLLTISATDISAGSIASGTVVYDKPQQINLTTSKPIASLGDITLTAKNSSGTVTNIPVSVTYSGTSLNVNYAEVLPRKDTIDLHIANLTATDQSGLASAYDLSFTTSGGPVVSGINLPSFGVNSGQTIVVSFDQSLLASQDPSKIASINVNGSPMQASYSINGSDIDITPSTAYPVCATITVNINSSAASNYGISGDSNHSYNSRSHCYTTFSIGSSVLGRPITAYKFGNGPSMVLYIAAMEGNEQNSANLLTQWIPAVDANPGKIPSYRTLVIIPQINPDGYAANTRLNAAGIDLNRNFPANNWQTQVTEPLGNGAPTNGGGPTPLSAPESQALANFYETNKPRLAITEHSHGGIVEANDAGDSIALGTEYAKLSNYRAIPTSQIGNFFNYTTTGAFEDWANDKLGLPVLEVELQSPTNDEYSRNLPALWAMAQVSQ